MRPSGSTRRESLWMGRLQEGVFSCPRSGFPGVFVEILAAVVGGDCRGPLG